MLMNAISGARSKLIRELKNRRDIFGSMSVVLSLGQDNVRNGSFVHLNRNSTKTLYNHIKKAKGLP